MNQRAQFADTMLRLMTEDDRLAVLLGDVGPFTFREHMERWPGRCLNTGCTEAATVGMAAGMALEGLFPVVSTIEPFLLRRAYEFIRLDFAKQNLPGLFVAVGRDGYPGLGPSHECPEAGLLLSGLGGLSIFEPATADDVDRDIAWACRERRLTYVRLET